MAALDRAPEFRRPANSRRVVSGVCPSMKNAVGTTFDGAVRLDARSVKGRRSSTSIRWLDTNRSILCWRRKWAVFFPRTSRHNLMISMPASESLRVGFIIGSTAQTLHAKESTPCGRIETKEAPPFSRFLCSPETVRRRIDRTAINSGGMRTAVATARSLRSGSPRACRNRRSSFPASARSRRSRCGA